MLSPLAVGDKLCGGVWRSGSKHGLSIPIRYTVRGPRQRTYHAIDRLEAGSVETKRSMTVGLEQRRHK